ncbi:MAG: SusC/RagA family TonB-linked outer membrane protein, partial [Bacteroides acidifaciens]|nr:SusC/RagA family TonB-linked outer membrane protein [Bacteroides acidifaciens]
MAQTKTATGVVTDQSGETVIGASVIVKGTTNGTITDIDGKFTLSNVKDGDIIQISFVGYKTQEIKFAGQMLNVVLRDDTEVLDEVVVTGYGGAQKRATLTTAISKLDNSVLKNAAFSNAGQSLQGSVTGLRVVNTTGQPGTNPDITLRGGATITGDNSNALVVVDGIVRNSMSDVNPSDIESIQILKDAASTAIYGARANGGVILIETKSGKEGKTSVNYKFKIGKNFTRKGYEFVNAEDYIYYNRLGMLRTNQAREGRMGTYNVDTQAGYGVGNTLYDIRYLTDETAHLQNEGWSVMNDPYYDGKQILFRDYNGQLDDEVFSSSAITQDHYLNITGGNEKSTFASSLGYYNEDGMVKGTGFKRFSGSFNGSYKIFPILNVKAGVSYVWSTRPELWIGTYEFFYRTRSQRPTWNPWMEDGSPASGGGTGDGNPAYYRDLLTQKNSTARATYNLGFTLDILPKELVLNGNASLLNYQYQREKFDKAYQTQTSSTPNKTRNAEAWIQKYNQIQLNASLAYTKTFAEKHNLDAMIGGEYYTYNQFDFEAKTQGSPTDDVSTLNVGSERTFTRTEKTAYRILSGFGRINYNYNMKHLLSFT